MEQLLFEELNRIDMVGFLASIEIRPEKIKETRFLYRSPLPGHPTNRPTFIVDRKLNRWRETDTRQSGTLVDFAVLFYHCTIRELREKLLAAVPPVLQNDSSQSTPEATDTAIEQTHPIRSLSLTRYLWERRIPLDVAQLYCIEAYYTQDKKAYCGLGFRSDAGGYELYHRRQHCRVPPYGPTHITNQTTDIVILREVFDLLTFATIFPSPLTSFPDFLVLNAPLSFYTVLPIIRPYRNKHLFLPQDSAGIVFSDLATSTLRGCRNHRSLYAGYPSLHDWTCRIGTASNFAGVIPPIDAS